MLGVLLQRPAAAIEVVNDANDRVVNFWRMVRDYPEDLYDLCRKTPHSKAEFLDCRATIDEGSPLERARKFVCAVSQGMIASDGPRNSWLMRSAGHVASNQLRPPGQIDALAQRMRHVQIERASDACAFLRRVYAKKMGSSGRDLLRPAVSGRDEHQRHGLRQPSGLRGVRRRAPQRPGRIPHRRRRLRRGLRPSRMAMRVDAHCSARGRPANRQKTAANRKIMDELPAGEFIQAGDRRVKWSTRSC